MVELKGKLVAKGVIKGQMSVGGTAYDTIVPYPSRINFPRSGHPAYLYVAIDEKMLYCWDERAQEYFCVGVDVDILTEQAKEYADLAGVEANSASDSAIASANSAKNASSSEAVAIAKASEATTALTGATNAKELAEQAQAKAEEARDVVVGALGTAANMPFVTVDGKLCMVYEEG